MKSVHFPRPHISRRLRLLGLVGLIVVLMGFTAYGAFQLTTTNHATVNGATTATLSAATVSFPNQTSTLPCTITGNVANCPSVELTQGGSLSEAGNYTINVSFTANPAGALLGVNCSTTGPLSCNPPNQTLFATGSTQTANVMIKASGSTGSGTATVNLTG